MVAATLEHSVGAMTIKLVLHNLNQVKIALILKINVSMYRVERDRKTGKIKSTSSSQKLKLQSRATLNRKTAVLS